MGTQTQKQEPKAKARKDWLPLGTGTLVPRPCGEALVVGYARNAVGRKMEENADAHALKLEECGELARKAARLVQLANELVAIAADETHLLVEAVSEANGQAQRRF